MAWLALYVFDVTHLVTKLNDSSYRKKSAFPPYVTLCDETKSRSSSGLPLDRGWAINFARGPL